MIHFIQPTARRHCACIALGFMLVSGFRPVDAQAPPASVMVTLRDVLDSARNTYPAVRAAEARVRAATGARTTAGLPSNPMLMYQVDQTPFPGGSALPPGMYREGMTTLTLPFEFLYQRGPRVARANADVRAAASSATATQRQVSLEAADAFYRTALAQTRVTTTRDLVSWFDTLVAYNQSRVEEGVVAESDLIRATVERDRMLADLAMQEAELSRARAALAVFISKSAVNERIEVAMDSMPLAIPAGLNVVVRPEVRAAHERLTASQAGVSSERTMMLRELGATIGSMQSGGSTSMIAGLSLPLPIFDLNRGEIRRAQAERDMAGFELDEQERTARADLRAATDAASVLSARMSQLAGASRNDSTSLLARADASRRIALGAYREGAVPLLQVIDAARAWADARTTYYETLFAQHQSVLTLVVASGYDLSTILSGSRTSGEEPR